MAVWARGRLKGRPQPADSEIVVLDDSDVEVVCRNPLHEDKQREAGSEGTLQDKAAARLTEALGMDHRELAGSIAEAIITVGGTDAAHRIRALVSALRTNAVLRSEVIREGKGIATKLASQDTREWASEDLKAQREAWAKSSMAEASRLGGDIRPCPECGGRAVFSTGSTAAYKMAKSYAHYTCIEVSCGKETHLAE
mmetsp:Transcript_149067/g.415451  ORF Transcript_149067/g.415451 Transcript_149067/m.415451 type:complete len:197 (+) Transcript_149067:135-725(+)